MAEVHDDDNALFAIEVDMVNDYAGTAAADSTTNHQIDDAATTTTTPQPQPVSRTFQSETAFQAQKHAYRAKIDHHHQGNLEAELVRLVPALGRRNGEFWDLEGGNTTMTAAAAAGGRGHGDGDGDGDGNGNADGEETEDGKGEDGKEGGKVKLSKKEVQLLGYTVGAMYFEKRFQEFITLCERVLIVCELDAKTRVGVEKWIQRSQERIRGG